MKHHWIKSGWPLLLLPLLVMGRLNIPQNRIEEKPESGTITGKVVYLGGTVQKVKNVIMDENTCGNHDILDESLLTGPEGGLRWAVVRIKGPVPDGKTWDDVHEIPVLDQKGCTFRPHVLVAGPGQPVVVANDDPTLHNVRTVSMFNAVYSKAQIYLPGTPPPRDTVRFDEPEPVKVVCDVHGWMQSWIYVNETPYATVTGEDGSFRLTGVPPGKYTLETWHEKLGKQQQTITVQPGSNTEVTFRYKAL